jgi:hypothetical protein
MTWQVRIAAVYKPPSAAWLQNYELPARDPPLDLDAIIAPIAPRDGSADDLDEAPTAPPSPPWAAAAPNAPPPAALPPFAIDLPAAAPSARLTTVRAGRRAAAHTEHSRPASSDSGQANGAQTYSSDDDTDDHDAALSDDSDGGALPPPVPTISPELRYVPARSAGGFGGRASGQSFDARASGQRSVAAAGGR